METFDIVVLAAGHGKRMQSELPKVLVPFNGKPLISHLLGAISSSGFDKTPVIVVGQKAELVKESLGDSYRYALQAEQLGTGHAVLSAKDMTEREAQNIMVLYGDQPSVTGEMISNLAKAHTESGALLTMATVILEDFNEWRSGFYHFGRIIRNTDGSIDKIVEFKDATEEEKESLEVNPAYFCFNSAWLWEHLEKLKNNNNQGEYYLTDLVHMVREEGREIATIAIAPKMALGVNTKEQLELLETITE